MKTTIKAVLGLSIILSAATFVFAKPIPAGIVNLSTNEMSPPDSATITNLAKRPWTNPNIDGMRVKTFWSYVQPLANSYDWTGPDEALRQGAKHGKFIGLSVCAGTNTPNWVYASGATKYALRDGSGLSMPLPWDTKFLNKWLPFVHALGQRYDGNPALRYVVMSGLGQQMETYLAKTSADDTALTALGGTSSWIVGAKKIIAAYADAFPTTPFFITMARPFPSTNPGTAALQQVVDWGVATYPGRFGLMSAGLNANSNTGYYPNEAIYTYRQAQPNGFQMVYSYIKDGGLRIGGTLNKALTNGVQMGGKFVEVWEPDVEDPKQQTVLATQGRNLKANAQRSL